MGIDEWVWATVGLLTSLRDGNGVAISTVVAYGNIGAAGLFEFLTTVQPDGHPWGMTTFGAAHVRKLVAWSKLKYSKPSTAQNRYAYAKGVIAGLIGRGHIAADEEGIFPSNPFPGAQGTKRGVQPLSPAEMQQLASALKADLVDLHQGRFKALASEALAVYFLVISMRCGCNTTPLLEMPRDALGPHPFLPNMRLLTTHKRRGNATRQVALRYSELQESVFSAPMDAVAIIQRVLASTAPLVADAPAKLKDRVWLYRTVARGVHPGGEVTALSNELLLKRIRGLIKRHGLLGDGGGPLRVTPQVLRKTMENRLWRLSDGDLIGVAQVMGHAPEVADQHYLRLDASTLEEGAEFVGEALPDILRGRKAGAIPIKLHDTPTGGCKDTLHGAKAPNDGQNECEQFTHCLGCPSYAIVGSLKDLHRLFSFQAFLQAEADYYDGDEWSEWRTHHQSLVRLIDDFTGKSFAASTVREARALASRAPHKFWALRIARAQRARGRTNEI
jgi:hypothetical protein